MSDLNRTRKSNVRTLVRNTGDLMLRDFEGDVKNWRKISVQTVIFIQRAKRRWFIMLSRSMLSKFRSNQRFVLLVNKSSQDTALSNNIGERNMELSNETQWYGSRLEQDCGGRRGRWWKTEEVTKGFFNIFWWIRRWKMGDIRYWTSKWSS